MKEPEELTCDRCGKTKPFRSRPDKSHPKGQIAFPDWKTVSVPVCRNCRNVEYQRRKYARKRNAEKPGSIEAYVIYKRERIPRPRSGSDSDRCKRFTSEAVTVLDARLDFMEVYETRQTVNVKVSFRTRAKITPEQFRDLCIAAMDKDRK